MEGLSESQAQMVQDFVSVTNADVARAREMLQDNKWDLDMSICTFLTLMEDNPEMAAAAPPAAAPEPTSRAGDDEEQRELERALAASMEPGPSGKSSASMPSQPPAGAAPSGAPKSKPNKLLNEMEAMAGESGTTQEAFRNFAAEGMNVPTVVGAAGMAAGPAKAPADDGFEALFPPPADLLFHGNFDALRKHCESERKYCLVNIQKRDEFTSHMLNRDTWKDPAVKTLIGPHFVFWQQQFESVAGSQHLSLYPAMELPLVDIVDPVTGALLERFNGYLAPEEMTERLTRFLDSHTWGKMGKGVTTAAPVIPVTQTQLHGVLGPGQSGGGGGGGRMSIDNEEQALNAAIMASMQDQAPPPGGCFDDETRQRSDSASASHYTDSLRVMQDAEFQESLAADAEKERIRRQEEEEKALEAAREQSMLDHQNQIVERKRERLAAEFPAPAGDGAGVANLLLRLPDGARLNRRFAAANPLSAVLDFLHCEGNLDPESHTVSTTFPRKVLDDQAKTLEELGLVGQTALVVERR